MQSYFLMKPILTIHSFFCQQTFNGSFALEISLVQSCFQNTSVLLEDENESIWLNYVGLSFAILINKGLSGPV